MTAKTFGHLFNNQRFSILFRDRTIAALLFLVALVILSLEWRYSLSNGSMNLQGGVSTVGAERVLNGDLPYRDFWTMYAPGHFYLLALLFLLFGNHLFVEVIAASIVTAGTVVVIYMIGRRLFDNHFRALVPAGIFLAAMYNTAYFKRLGSYPTGIFLAFLASFWMIRYYQTDKTRYLIIAGIAVSISVIFKHDVAGYTFIALTTGLIVHHIVRRNFASRLSTTLWKKILLLALAAFSIAGPIMIYFSLITWPDMIQNLVIFPLTDFRYARPEGYPGLLPIGLISESILQTLKNFFTYIHFNIPLILSLLGVVAVVVFIKRRRYMRAAMGVTFIVAYFLHYSAAHVQINTHIVSMSVYAAWLGLMAYELFLEQSLPIRRSLIYLAGIVLTIAWLIAFIAKPAYTIWQDWQTASIRLSIPKVSGFNVTPDEARTLEDLMDFVNQHIPPDQPIFVGLHRHDVVVIGDIMIQFILDRPIATRYQELHPAITDTQPVQQEIIRDIQEKNVDYIILRKIFPDHVLDPVKQDFLKNLPYIGAMDLDDFIRDEYIQIEQFGPYTVWQSNTISQPEQTESIPKNITIMSSNR